MDGWSAGDRRRIQAALEHCTDARASRRLMAVLLVMQGNAQAEVAATLDVAELTVWRWVQRYRESRDPEGLADAPRCGRPRALEAGDLRKLQRLLKSSPQDLGLAAVGWTVPLLQQELLRRGGSACSRDTLRRVLHQMDLAWKRPRYVLQRDPEAEEKRAAFSADSCS